MATMNYKVVDTKNGFKVEEKATGYTVRMFDTKDQAKKYMKFLNLGGGFDGWTPQFILNNSSKNM